MFTIKEKKGNKYGVLDTDDNTIEYYTIEELISITETTGIKIKRLEPIMYSYKVVNLRYLVNDFFKFMGDYDATYNREENIHDNVATASLRDWGEWHNPEWSEDSDYDEEDYDWKELDKKWYGYIKSVKEALHKKYPTTNISITTGEKCYIYLEAII